jgi:hypothetical protein
MDMTGTWGVPGMMNPALAAMAFQQLMFQQQQMLLLQQQQALLVQQQQQRQAQQRRSRPQHALPSAAPNRFAVRGRGLPFSANEAMIAEFFDDVKIPRQGVHMVLNLQDRPTGEAFVEVETEEDVQLALNHNGGALGHRYIEVFRSSIADMNRLGGGDPGPGQGLGVDAMLPAAPFFPMFPIVGGAMPSMSVGLPAVPSLSSIKVDVKPNEEYLRWYNENRRRQEEEAGASAASGDHSLGQVDAATNAPNGGEAIDEPRSAAPEEASH